MIRLNLDFYFLMHEERLEKCTITKPKRARVVLLLLKIVILLFIKSFKISKTYQKAGLQARFWMGQPAEMGCHIDLLCKKASTKVGAGINQTYYWSDSVLQRSVVAGRVN